MNYGKSKIRNLLRSPMMSFWLRMPQAWSSIRTVNAMVAMSAMLLGAGLVRAETGVTAQTVLIGQSVSLTGPLAAIGTDFSEGFKVYVDEVNRGGASSAAI